MTRQPRLVYALLAAAWVPTVVWQSAEHIRVRRSAQAALVNHAKDVSTTLGVVLRSQRRFGVIPRERIESALHSLLRPGELDSIALLNNAAEVVASAGDPIDFELKGLVPGGQHWGPRRVTLVNLVDLGSNLSPEGEPERPTLVLARTNLFGNFGTNRPPPPPPPSPTRPAVPEPVPRETDPGGTPGPAESSESADTPSTSTPTSTPTNEPPARSRGWGRSRGGDRRPPPFGRPFGMSEEEYRSMVEKQGVHGFVVVLSARPMITAANRDLWLRGVITLFASLSVIALGLAWRNLFKSSELEVRLARASELNARLKEMNLAAAGLAHETRNPLNIIRGLAQMISRQDAAPPELRQRSRDIIQEADRVTAQLNEFINYSRPREVRRVPVALASAVSEVKRALEADLEEKSVQLDLLGELPVIEADEPLLRQALFNLLLNAIQAVDRGGRIEVACDRLKNGTATLEIRDNGPGVPVELRDDIFKPYFTTHQKGTGLGLAVVHQIVLAHGWEIAVDSRPPRGAVFRLSHLRLAAGP